MQEGTARLEPLSRPLQEAGRLATALSHVPALPASSNCRGQAVRASQRPVSACGVEAALGHRFCSKAVREALSWGTVKHWATRDLPFPPPSPSQLLCLKWSKRPPAAFPPASHFQADPTTPIRESEQRKCPWTAGGPPEPSAGGAVPRITEIPAGRGRLDQQPVHALPRQTVPNASLC